MLIEPIIRRKNNKKYIDHISLDEFISNNDSPAMIFNGKRLKELSKYMLETLKNNYINTEVHYAIKACYTPSVLKIFKQNHIKFEVMSEFEYKLVKKLGIKGNELILNGPGKTNKLLEMAILDGVELINIDSEEELIEITNIAKKYNKIVKVGLRIQPNVPDGSFLTRGEKLGVDQRSGQAEKLIKKMIDNKNVDLLGIQFHSCINQSNGDNIITTLDEVIKFIKLMYDKYKFKPEYVDIGGGLATIENWRENSFEKFATELGKKMKKIEWNPTLIIEPGRFLVSDCAIVIAKIIRKKMNGDTRWIIVNGNTNMLIPLASADFKVESIQCDNEKLYEYNVGDCLCSASGTLQRNVLLPENLKAGDYIIIKNAGAYTVNLSEPFAEPIMPIYLTDANNYRKIHNGVNIEEMIEYFLEGNIKE